MHTQRNRWLAGLSKEEFVGLDPWQFIAHTESKAQWIAEVRQKLTVKRPDQEILSALYVGLYDTVSRALARHKDIAPERRAFVIIGSALAYVRQEGLPALYNELIGSDFIVSSDCIDAMRSHGLEHEYASINRDYIESLPSQPQFLADEQPVGDTQIQERHILCELARIHLTQRELEVMRLMVIDTLGADDIAEALAVTKRQVWKVQQRIRAKLLDLATMAGVATPLITEYSRTLKSCSSNQSAPI